MSLRNVLWGAPRRHGELLKLGIEVSQATVAKYMVKHRKPPSQSWRTFLENHVRQLVSVDFFVVPTLTFRILYLFLVLAHERRRVVRFNLTSIQWRSGQQHSSCRRSPGKRGGDGEDGGQAPALVGSAFAANDDGQTVGDLVERSRKTMPVGREGRQSRQYNVDITAYILQCNRIPPGFLRTAGRVACTERDPFLATRPSQDAPPEAPCCSREVVQMRSVKPVHPAVKIRVNGRSSCAAGNQATRLT